MSERYNRYALNASVFLCGAVVMIFELAGSRMMAPYLGTSIFVWTSIIGVILGSLSFGYWLGGKMADKKADLDRYSFVILWSAICIYAVFLSKDFILNYFEHNNFSIEANSLLSSVFLFAPASILLGIISPYATRLKITGVEHSGATVGNLYAISTLGSIAGTFFAGFYLIPRLGTTNIILALALILALVSFSLSRKKIVVRLILLFLIIFSFWANAAVTKEVYSRFGLLDIDTKYNRIIIAKGTDRRNNKPILTLNTDPFGTQSAMYIYEDDLVFDYTKYYRLAGHFVPDINNALMLGGCAYSYPKDYLKNYPKANLDVVEIDPGMTEVAKKYFNLKDDPRLKIIHEDARTFLNKTENKYDVIYNDAFNSFSSIPFQLTTEESVLRQYEILNNGGIAMSNIISAIDGNAGKFLRAEYATYKKIFPQVYIFPVSKPDDSRAVQNIMLVAIKAGKMPSFESQDSELNGYLKNKWKLQIAGDMPILTDDFAPVDYYKLEAI